MATHTETWDTDAYDGLMDWLGKNKGVDSWAHPETSRSLVVSSQSSTLSGMVSSRALDQATGTATGRSHTNTDYFAWWQVQLVDAVITPTHIGVRAQNHSNGMQTKFQIEGSLDGISWDVLAKTATFVSNNAWYSTDVTADGPYQYFRIMRYESSAHLIIGEFEVWGEYDDSVPPADYGGDAVFAYNAEGGHNGLINWLGQNKVVGTTYANPDTGSAGGVDLITSTINTQLSTYYPYKAFNRSAADSERAHSTDAFDSWWKIDLGSGNTFIPSGVAMQSSASGTDIRNFRIEGSNNDTDWTELYDVPDSTTGPSVAYGWFVADLSAVSTAYRYIRIFMYGTDSSTSTHYLTLAEVEFYGTYNPVSVPFSAASNSSDTAASSLTWAHTIGTADDRLLLVGVSTYTDGGSAAPTGVTYNSVSMTKLAGDTAYGSSDHEYVSLWYLVAPATGSNNIVVTMAGTEDEIVGAAVSYIGVDQSTPVGTGSGTAPDAVTSVSQAISSATGDRVVDFVAMYAPSSVTVGAGQTARLSQDNGAGVNSVYMSDEIGASTTTMSWSFGSSEYPGHIAVNVNAVSAVTVHDAIGTVTGTGSLSGAASRSTFGAGTLTGTGSVSAAGTLTSFVSGTLTGSSLVAGTGTLASFVSGTLTGSGSLSGTGTWTAFADGTVTGSGSVAGAATRSTFGAATVTGTGSMSAAATRSTFGAATVTGTGSMSGTAWQVFFTDGTVTGTGLLEGAATVESPSFTTHDAAGTLTGTGSMTGAVWQTFFVDASMTGSGSIAGAATRTTFGVGTVTGTGSMSGAVFSTMAASASITGIGAMSGAATRTTFTSGTLNGSGSMTATVQTFTPSGAFTFESSMGVSQEESIPTVGDMSAGMGVSQESGSMTVSS